ncbi:hypothetical protein ACJX0J_027601 [Zea mays]
MHVAIIISCYAIVYWFDIVCAATWLAAALVLRGIWYLFNYFFNIDILSQIPIIHMHCASIQMTYDLFIQPPLMAQIVKLIWWHAMMRQPSNNPDISFIALVKDENNVQNLDYNNRILLFFPELFEGLSHSLEVK